MPTQKMPVAPPISTQKYPGGKQSTIQSGNIGTNKNNLKQPRPSSTPVGKKNNLTKPNSCKKENLAPQADKETFFSAADKLKTQSSRDITTWAFVGIGVLIVIGAVYMLISSKAEKKYSQMVENAEEVLLKAKNLTVNNDFKAALDVYNKFLDDSRFKEYPKKDNVEETIKKIKHRMAKESEAKTKLEGLSIRLKKADKSEQAELEKELIAFITEYGETTSAAAAKQEVDNIRNSRKEEKKQSASELFKSVQMEADNLESQGQVEKALDKWREFAREYPEGSAILQKKINNEIVRLKKLMEKNKK